MNGGLGVMSNDFDDGVGRSFGKFRVRIQHVRLFYLDCDSTILSSLQQLYALSIL